jgi:Mg2+/Co2+ transporter CorC
MAAVINEWGAVKGVVEESVGDLQDQFDIEVAERESAIRSIEDGAYAVDSGVAISRVNEALETEFERADLDRRGQKGNGGERARNVGVMFRRDDSQQNCQLSRITFSRVETEAMNLQLILILKSSELVWCQ